MHHTINTARRLSALLTLALTMALAATAGTWTIHPVFGAAPTAAVDTGEKVFYLVSGNLYCYDKGTAENTVYDKSNYLSDTQIIGIYFNAAKRYLLVAYASANIDIILADGHVTNLPEIRDALLTSAKTINDVTFSADRAYVATAFGYVAINDTKMEVAESRVYGVNVVSAARVGGVIMLSTADGLYMGDASRQHNTMASYTFTDEYKSHRFYPLEGNCLIKYGPSASATYSAGLDAQGTPRLTYIANILGNNVSAIQPVKALGQTMVLFNTVPSYYTVAGDGSVSAAVTLPSSVKGGYITSSEADGSWWHAGTSGLRKITISGTTATNVLDYQKLNASTVTAPYRLSYDTRSGVLYVSNTAKCLQNNSGANIKLNTLSGGTWTELKPTSTSIQTYDAVPDPADSNRFYMASVNAGVLRFENGQQVGVWNSTNSGIAKNKYNLTECTAAQFDKVGNLWVAQGELDADKTFKVLPKDKVATSSGAADWIIPSISLSNSWKQTFYIAPKTGVMFFSAGSWRARLAVFKPVADDPAGTISKAEYLATNTLDQDNRNFIWNYIHCFAEDRNGNVWMGTDIGVVEINPTAALGTNYNVRRPKVSRNDGSGTADYLLSDITVNNIAVDGANRKWIATESDGLYLVSADGSEVIEHFTQENSVLPSNQVYSVCCNPDNGSVYVGAKGGLLEYHGDNTAPAPTYDDITVYPNPVRPDYTGPITVRGLKANSLVKIADASGSVVATLQATGGTVSWDGNGLDGERVRTGVYFVLASENTGDSSSAAVAKFLVIR